MTTFKAHVALNVVDVNRSVAFYQAMFGVAPVKYKAGYAKFDVENPALNLTLNQKEKIQPHGALSHLGVQVGSSEEVQAAADRFAAVGLSGWEEKNTDCCYALQDKVWVTDPDGNRWEVFVVKIEDTAPEKNLSLTSAVAAAPSQVSRCCA